MKKLISLVLCLTLLCGLIPALAEEEKETYIALYGKQVTTLNYLLSDDPQSLVAGANTVDSLVEYDARGKVLPGLAADWDVSADGKVWTFHLREGMKWVDRTGAAVADVTADDFVSAVRYMLDPANNSVWAESLMILDNAQEYYFSQANLLEEAMNSTSPEETYSTYLPMEFDQVGVKAPDPLTVEYTLVTSLPYFLSFTTEAYFLPAYGPLLEKHGEKFGTSADTMYSCGAYILTDFDPEVGQTMVRNEHYRDAAHVYIDEIDRRYDPEAETLGPRQAQRGKVDTAVLTGSTLAEWRKKREVMVSRFREAPTKSYFFIFNFHPRYNQAYDPDNWEKAVSNSNFRHSIMSALNREYVLLAGTDVTDLPLVLQNTITPSGFVSNTRGRDYTGQDALNDLNSVFFDEMQAADYRASAIKDLEADGVTLPVTLVLTWPEGDAVQADECSRVKQQLEYVLGTDYLQVELVPGEAGVSAQELVNSGKFSMTRHSYQAAFADPEAFTAPFERRSSCNSMEWATNIKDSVTGEVVSEYYAALKKAQACQTDINERYALFAAAEAILINHAIVIPYCVDAPGYQVTRLNVFEGGYAPFGLSTLRFKYMKRHVDYITQDEWNTARNGWIDSMK